MTSILINEDLKSSHYKNKKNEQKLVDILIKFEHNLKKLQQNINIDIMENQIIRLPNLNLNFTNNNDYDNYEENDDKKKNRRNKSTNSYKNSKTNSTIRSRTKSDPRSKLIQRFNDNDLQQSSIISSMSTNADLSEDEQINYYDDDNLNNQQNNIMPLTSLDPSSSLKNSIKTRPSTSNRRFSNCSDRTLILMPAESIITENINLNLDQSPSSVSTKGNNDKHFNQYNKSLPYQHNESEESDKGDNSEYISDENPSDEEINSDEELYDLKHAHDVKKINNLKSNDELISIKIKPKCFDDEDNSNNFERPPSLPKNDPPNNLMLDLLNNQANNTNNDLSDDEVKEYNVFKENLENYNI
jgi:hypothetical protein